MSLDTIDIILKRLPSHFDKSPSSNNYKALSLLAKHIDDSEKLYDAIQKFWDIDQAEGDGLDRLGKDEGISRGPHADETYKKLIKVQFIVSMSKGEIESINTILRAYMEDDFLFLEEGWNSYLEEPASLIVNVSKDAQSIPFQLVQRIKPTGVRVYYSAEVDRFTVIILPKEYTFDVPYPITNTFHTAPLNGIGNRTNANIQAKEYNFQVPYPITGTFFCGEGVN